MTASSTVTIGLVQTTVSADKDRNLAETLELVRSAIARGARIICLQELFRTRYFPQTEDADPEAYAETIPGESTDAFAALAREHGVVIVVPLYERAPSGEYFNTAVVIDADGRLLPAYRKVHIPYDPLFYEKTYFSPGGGYLVYDTRYARIAVLICYDQWFPEAARAGALQGADIILYPTAIGWIAGEENPPEGDWREAWETIQRSHAIANSVHVAAVNRVGREGDLAFWGSSFICDCFGTVVARGSDAATEVLVATLDLARNAAVREGWGFFRNRRPDTYGILTAAAALQTPREIGYRMPAEWERHDAVWLSWPHDRESFPDLEEVERSYVSLIAAIYRDEVVNLLVLDEEMRGRARGLLRAAGVLPERIRFHVTEYADVWFRDYGPTFVVNRSSGRRALVNWTFNAWGGKYAELMRDDAIPSTINRDLGLPVFTPGIVMEGGSIDVNGMGTLLTTEQCLLNPNRNPDLSRGDIEGFLRDYLGATHIIWLKDGVVGDDTDGHIDDIARFVNPVTVLCAVEEDEGDENYAPLRENYAILKASVDQNGNPLTVVPLPMPGRVGDGRRLPASYTNFYIGNTAVLVPIFGHANDERALRIIGGVFPDRRVIGIDCTAMVHGLGTIHCISQQQPSLTSWPPG